MKSLCLRSGAVPNREEIRRNPQKSAEIPYQTPLSKTPIKHPKQYPQQKPYRTWGVRRHTECAYYF